MGCCPKYTRKSIIAYVEQIKKQIACTTNEPRDWIRILGGIILDEEIQDKVILKDGNLIFCLAANHTHVEQRRKMAIMLGHLFLHMDRQSAESVYICCPFARDRRWQNERYNAEIFAMQLLMPCEVFETELSHHTACNRANMNEVAKTFDVDLRCAIDWGKSLGLLHWF